MEGDSWPHGNGAKLPRHTCMASPTRVLDVMVGEVEFVLRPQPLPIKYLVLNCMIGGLVKSRIYRTLVMGHMPWVLFLTSRPPRILHLQLS